MGIDLSDIATDPLLSLLARRLRLLGQPLRIQLLIAIHSKQNLPIEEIAHALGTTQQNISRHLGILFQAGILTRERHGTHIRYSLQDESVIDVLRDATDGISRRISELSRTVAHDEP